MNNKNIFAVILITLGIAVLASSGITVTPPGENIQLLGLRVETNDSHFIPPRAGLVALIGGIVLLSVKSRQNLHS